MVRIPIIHIITILTISLGLSCTSELAVKTKAVDVDCSDLDAESAILSQCLARESAESNLILTIATETFTSNTTDVSISWSEYPGAINYRLTFTEDKNRLKEVLAFDQLLVTKAASLTKDGTFHICVFA